MQDDRQEGVQHIGRVVERVLDQIHDAMIRRDAIDRMCGVYDQYLAVRGILPIVNREAQREAMVAALETLWDAGRTA